ncbi:hypothetical protein BC830DRAFT_1104658 [Chytriomyces sp. MP71]|nr:hypothetical protein BC830DRAFT_1104658 [Chytriomyces sp. MP71]
MPFRSSTRVWFNTWKKNKRMTHQLQVARQTTAVVSLGLLVKFYFTTIVQGGTRFKSGSRPPEDGRSKRAVVPQNFGIASAEGETEDAKHAKLAELRWVRIVQNDLENVPMGLIVAWSSLQNPYNATVHAVAVAVFGISRYVHTWAYAKGKQPHRTIAWLAGVASTLTLAINGVLGVFA